MKSIFSKIITIFVLSYAFTSCSSSDDQISENQQHGMLTLKFDHIFNDSDLIFNSPYTTATGEKVHIDQVKYIISNIVLTKDDGTEFTLPKELSNFVISEVNGSTSNITLANIPLANYTAVKFGLGIDESTYNQGGSNQGDFLAVAQNADMLWSWSAGYKFFSMEGYFFTQDVNTTQSFKIHTGKTGTAYNYSTISLNFTDLAFVRTERTPQVHIMVDLSKVFEGAHTISLSDQSQIMGGDKVAQVTANLKNMFKVHHLHNF